MGAGASTTEGRVFCHSCGARTTCSSEGSLRCLSCGSTEDVEATDHRLPTTLPSFTTSSASSSTALVPNGNTTDITSANFPLGRAAPASTSSNLQERSGVRVESVTVVATQREDGSLLLRVLPNVVARRETSTGFGETEDWENTSEPACAAFVSRLESLPVSEEQASHDDGDLCVICAEDLAEVGTPVVLLSCGHRFHEKCIRRWLGCRHTCPTCRFELEVDNVKYLRSIGCGEEADALEKVEQEKQARELQKQTAARRRWVQSMRRGDPVHFGLTCGHCAETPLIGTCFRCATCEGFVLCRECHAAHEADPSSGRHTSDHSFVEFGSPNNSPQGTGGQLTVLLPAPVRPTPSENLNSSNSPVQSQEVQAIDGPGEAALAAAEAAFVAVRSLAFAPLAGAGPSQLFTGSTSTTGAVRAVAAAVSVGGPLRNGLRR